MLSKLQTYQTVLDAMEKLEAKELISEVYADGLGGCCALGAVGVAKGARDRIQVHTILERSRLTEKYNAHTGYIARVNDNNGPAGETPAQRYTRMHAWLTKEIEELI